MNIFFAIVTLFGIFATRISFWALGQWLHGRDYDDRLDKINATPSKGQRNVDRFLGPLGGGSVGVARSISRVPFLGNRRSHEMWENLEELERQRRKDRS